VFRILMRMKTEAKKTTNYKYNLFFFGFIKSVAYAALLMFGCVGGAVFTIGDLGLNPDHPPP